MDALDSANGLDPLKGLLWSCLFEPQDEVEPAGYWCDELDVTVAFQLFDHFVRMTGINSGEHVCSRKVHVLHFRITYCVTVTAITLYINLLTRNRSTLQ